MSLVRTRLEAVEHLHIHHLSIVYHILMKCVWLLVPSPNGPWIRSGCPGLHCGSQYSFWLKAAILFMQKSMPYYDSVPRPVPSLPVPPPPLPQSPLPPSFN